jgi:tRNA pseudouridine55 synthase
MDGILVIDKPEGITSHDVVARVRRLLKTKRVGHTGTLDPFATGAMVILIGKATRLAQFLDKDEKEYVAVLRFGSETDTGDRTGKTTGSQDPAITRKILLETDWQKVFDSFRGRIMQTPPMYSAKKVEGTKLYELARRGETIERKAVEVDIRALEMIGEIDLDRSEMTIRVVCSAGTYIRTLSSDIARTAGGMAHLAELRRTRAGRFDLSHWITLSDLEASDDRSASLLPIGRAVEHLAQLELTDDRMAKTRSGLSTRIYDSAFAQGEAVRMESENGELIAVGVFDASENAVRPKVVLI